MKLVLAALCSVCFFSSALAQNQMMPSTIDTISRASMIQLLQDNGFSAEAAGETATSEIIKVTASGGGVFYMYLRSCEIIASVNKCDMIQPLAYFRSSGVTLSMTNELLRDKFVVAYAILLENNRGVISSKIILSGGVRRENIIAELAGYLYDVENLISAIKPGTIAQINYDSESIYAGVAFPDFPSNLASGGQPYVNPVGARAPKFLTEQLKAFRE